jgi:hypothetical protein
MPESTATKEKVVEAIPEVKNPYWVAIVYRPKRESNAIEDIDSVDYNEAKRPLPVFVRQIMLPPEQATSGQGSGPSFDWIELRPGANIHILYSDWQRAASMPLVKALIGVSVDVVATSLIEDDKPGYRLFSSAEAIRLVKLTTASGWIDEWMDGEVRAEVIKAANERKVFLETELAKRVS